MKNNRRERLFLFPLLFLILGLFWGCDGEPAQPSILDPDSGPFERVSEFLTPGLAAALDEEGLFRSVRPRPGPFEMITEEDASELALGWVKRFGPYNLNGLERQHRSSIDLGALEVIGRVVVAETPWAPIPSNVPMPLQKHLGPYYLVTLGNGGIPAITVAVSAYSTDWEVVEGRAVRGRVGRPYGNEFRWVGVTPDGKWGNPRSPEGVAVSVAEISQARVAEAPIFVRRAPDYVPLAGYWRVKLDRMVSARVTDGNGTLTTDVLYVGWDGVIHASVPPTEEPPRFRYSDGGVQRYTTPRGRDDMFERLAPVEVVQKGGAQ